MVACLPLVQQVRGSIPGGVVNFNFKIFNLGARRGGCMLTRHTVLSIAIRPSNGDVKPGGPLVQAMSRHRVSPSPFLSSSSCTTQLHYSNSYTYSHPIVNFLPYPIQILIPHVMWSVQAMRDSKIDHT